MTEWISCEEQYPEFDGRLVEVVAINMDEPSPFPFVVHYSGERERGFELLKVTHWYPLPGKRPVGWLPFPENIPEESGDYLITDDNGFLGIDHWLEGWSFGGVIAFRPGIEPYKE